jgi:heptaprenyl diphosphate synthase
MRTRTETLTLCAALAAAALVLSYIEHLIPLPLPASGVKLGFANIAVLIALYRLDGRSALMVNILRIVLSGLLFAGLSAMLYALAGGIPGVLVMILLKRTGRFSVFGVSVGGAATHIAGQLALASLVIQNGAVFLSFPPLLAAAAGSGLLIGFISRLLLRALPHPVRNDGGSKAVPQRKIS